MIDKSLLTPAELAFFEDIEKRCSIDPEQEEIEKANTGGKEKPGTSGILMRMKRRKLQKADLDAEKERKNPELRSQQQKRTFLQDFILR